MNIVWILLKETWKQWNEDRAPRLAAALAYATLFSLAPLLIIMTAVIGAVLDEKSAQAALATQLGYLLGGTGTQIVERAVESASDTSLSIPATLIGLVALLFGSTVMFAQLQDVLNTVWGVAPKPGRGLLTVVRARFLSFAVVVGIGFLLLVSLAVSAVLQAVNTAVSNVLPGADALWFVANALISFGMITVLFALIYKFLPDVKIAWSNVWVGASVTALLFSVGKYLLGLYLGREATGSVYGAAGSLTALLVWIYYSCLIFSFGAEFTHSYAQLYGSRIVPSRSAVALTTEDRLHQGIPRMEELEAAVEREEEMRG